MEKNLSWETKRQPLKKFSTFYGTQRFITVFTTRRHWSLSWARRIQSTHPHNISLRAVPMLSSQLHTGLQSGLFPSVFPIKPPVNFSHLSHACYMSRSSHSPWFDHPNNIWWSVQFMKLLITQSPPTSYHFLPLKLKYSHHSVLKRPPLIRDQVSRPYKTTGKLWPWSGDGKTDSKQKCSKHYPNLIRSLFSSWVQFWCYIYDFLDRPLWTNGSILVKCGERTVPIQ
jgi:hypothetical protein